MRGTEEMETVVCPRLFDHHWENEKSDRDDWAHTVQSFQNCNLAEALYIMGWRVRQDPGSAHVSSALIGARKSYYGQYLALVTGSDGNKVDLSEIWIDPEVRGALDREKKTPNSMSLLSQCESRIEDGDADINTRVKVGMYYIALGNPKAISWLNAAGEAGIADAYVLLGHAYRKGLLSPVKDEKLAFSYYLKAARGGSLKGQIYVAELLRSVDRRLARSYLMAAAEGGSLTAAYKLQDSSIYFDRTAGEINRGQVAKEGYFWNLVFIYLHGQREAKTNGTWHFLQPGKLSLLGEKYVKPYASTEILPELPREFEFDGLPESVWRGDYGRDNKATKVMERFSLVDAQKQQNFYEGNLDADSRVLVQEAAKKWIAARSDRDDVDSARAEEPKRSNKMGDKLPPWKPLQAAICGEKIAGAQLSAADLYKSFKQFVWTVNVSLLNEKNKVLGTAVAVGPNVLVTNCHVVQGAESISIVKDSVSHRAILIAANPARDACVLQVESQIQYVSNALPIFKIEIGATAYAIGNPQGMELTLSNGIVSGIRKHEGKEFIQTTAPISQGSSGGALTDDRGNLLGITTFYLRGGQAMNFAIPIGAFCQP